MATALRTSLEGLFDDAGLFPPARRPMAEALAVHSRVRQGPHGALVGPFLCPAGRLDELDACLASGVPQPDHLGLVLYPGDEVVADQVLHRSRPSVVQVEAPAEFPLPAAALQRPCYLELHSGGDPAERVDRVASRGARVKVRCGGGTPDLVPPVEWLAAVLYRAAGLGVVVKATAGLHEPFPGEDPTRPRHGFINLLAAASAAVQGSDVDELAAVLSTPAARGDALVARVDRRARGLLASIGTCSLDEPIQALVDLGMGG